MQSTKQKQTSPGLEILAQTISFIQNELLNIKNTTKQLIYLHSMQSEEGNLYDKLKSLLDDVLDHKKNTKLRQYLTDYDLQLNTNQGIDAFNAWLQNALDQITTKESALKGLPDQQVALSKEMDINSSRYTIKAPKKADTYQYYHVALYLQNIFQIIKYVYYLSKYKISYKYYKLDPIQYPVLHPTVAQDLQLADAFVPDQNNSEGKYSLSYYGKTNFLVYINEIVGAMLKYNIQSIQGDPLKVELSDIPKFNRMFRSLQLSYEQYQYIKTDLAGELQNLQMLLKEWGVSELPLIEELKHTYIKA